MDGAKAKASKEAVTQDIKAQNKKRQLEFRAQHGLVVAFFLLILYVCCGYVKYSTVLLTAAQNLSRAGNLSLSQWLPPFPTRLATQIRMRPPTD